jgi:hypothetical protein
MIAGYSYELVQDPPPLLLCRPVSFSNRFLKLSACRHARLPGHLLYHPAAPLPGSSLREATDADPVTKIVSQCGGRFELSPEWRANSDNSRG